MTYREMSNAKIQISNKGQILNDSAKNTSKAVLISETIRDFCHFGIHLTFDALTFALAIHSTL